MSRCLQLASLGRGNVHPNPMVGSVIAHDGKIIGEGYHQIYGGPHAEVMAINSVTNMEFLTGSTLYVNLEPCCHWGKTPPCTDLIIKSGIKKVVIGSLDKNPLVAGKGVEILENTGVEVISRVLEKDCLILNESFFSVIGGGKDYVKFIVKWAESADGFMGKPEYANQKEKELSNTLVKRWVHKIRSETDAILVGTNTAMIDDPLLDNRHWMGKIPTAVILDKALKIPSTANLFKPERRVIIFNELKDNLDEKNVRFIKLDFNTDDKLFWKNIEEELIRNNIYSALLEGGSQTIQSFFRSGIGCEVIRIKTNKIWANGIKAPELDLPVIDRFYLGNDLVEMMRKGN